MMGIQARVHREAGAVSDLAGQHQHRGGETPLADLRASTSAASCADADADADADSPTAATAERIVS